MARQVLFDLAVGAALRYAERLGLLEPLLQGESAQGLERWYLTTRFAYRIPFVELIAVLEIYPGKGHVWRGGKTGSWQTKSGAHSAG